MKSPISNLLVLATLVSLAHLHAQTQPSFFSFLNAIATNDPTTLTVNGKKMGGPYPFGFYTGGMGFMESSATLSITNGKLLPKVQSLQLSPTTSPIIIAYLKIEPPPPGEGETKKIIKLVGIPCSTAAKTSLLRAVYVGGKDPIVLDIKSGRGSEGKGSATQLKLIPDTPVKVSLKGSPLQFFIGDTPVGVYDAESKDNFLLVFYPAADGKLAMTTVLDIVLE